MKGDIYEVEDAKLSGCSKADNQDGYQGTGFVDFGEKGSYVEWDNVLADSAGEYTLTFRYAAAGGARPCEVLINGQKAGRVEFSATKDWSDWKTDDIKVNFNKGGNFVKVVAIGDGPNLDALAVNK